MNDLKDKEKVMNMSKVVKEGKSPGIYSYKTKHGIKIIKIMYYVNGEQIWETLGPVKLSDAVQIRNEHLRDAKFGKLLLVKGKKVAPLG